jgi:predicted O-linked N-acetylglucosamine transferase (SPINDLY family)
LPKVGNVFLYALHFCSDYDAKALLAEHRKWGELHERPLANQRRSFDNDPDPDRRLKIGYVSADFCNHPVGRFLVPLFASHDHRQVEICCYSDQMKPVDSTTRQLKGAADRWQIIKGISDVELAELIRKDRIDILVDLAQHSADNRLMTFAHKPAPVQVTWLGYPGTTGLNAMDYRLTDLYLDPPGQGDENYTECSIRLPHCFWCYEPLETTSPVNALPAMQNGYVTFGCMNRFNKVTTASLELWRRILLAVPNSRLLIHSPIGDHLNAIRRRFVEGGIASRRVEFIERQPMPRYLWEYYRMDIGLDPFPHGGGTVTCDSMWMGMPVVTLSGRTAVGRGGVSLLSNVGLPELIAHSEEEYLSIAVELASDLPRLAALRAGLREKMKASPLMDGKRFAGDMEAAYRQMWRMWCASRSEQSGPGPRP